MCQWQRTVSVFCQIQKQAFINNKENIYLRNSRQHLIKLLLITNNKLQSTEGGCHDLKKEEAATFRIYTKDLNGSTKIRRERQEYPNKRFDEAMEEKLPTVIKMRAVPKDA